MRSLLLIIAFTVTIASLQEVTAQPTYAYIGTSTVANSIPFSSGTSNKRQWVYYPSDFPGAPAGSITTLYIRASASTTANYSLLEIKMGHTTSITTFTAGPFATGLTTVYSGSASISTITGNWMVITLTTPFSYNGTQNLIIEASQTGASPGFSVMQQTSGVTDRTIYGGIASSTGSTQNRLAELGFDLLTTPCTSPPTAGTSTISPTIVCQGEQFTLDLTGNSVGLGQTYQWEQSTSVGEPYTNVGSSQPNSGTLVTSTTNLFYHCKVTCSGVTTTSSPVQINVTTPLVPAISIVSDTNNFCQGTSVTFTATPVNGGVSPDYQWKRNGLNIGTNSDIFTTTSMANGDAVTCELTTSESCVSSTTANSNSINMNVITKLPASVNMTVDPGSEICEGDSVTFNVTSVNGGATPVYQWKKNNVNVGTNGTVYGDGEIMNSDVIRCEMVSSEGCVTPIPAAAATIMKVNPLPDKPLIKFNGNVLTITTTAPHIQWFIDGNLIPSDTLATLIAIDSGWYSVRVTDEKGCSISSFPVLNIGVVGVPELADNKLLNVYPLPAHNELMVEIEEVSNGYQLELRNLTGQKLYSYTGSDNLVKLDLTSLNSGMYLLSVRFTDKTITRRVVKN